MQDTSLPPAEPAPAFYFPASTTESSSVPQPTPDAAQLAVMESIPAPTSFTALTANISPGLVSGNPLMNKIDSSHELENKLESASCDRVEQPLKVLLLSYIVGK